MSNSIQWLAPNMRSISSWLGPSRWMPAQSANTKLSRDSVQSSSSNQGLLQPQHGSRTKKPARQHWLSKHRMSRKRLKQQQQLRKKLQ